MTGVRFFETPSEIVPYDQRLYSWSFDRSATRYIAWELKLAYPAPGRRIDFVVNAVYSHSDGSVFARQTTNAYLLGQWTWSTHSRGERPRNHGNWLVDSYRVILYIDDEEVASGEFTVTE